MNTRTPLIIRKSLILLAVLLALVPALSFASPTRAGTCTVTSDDDSGEGTMRALLADANCEKIDFAYNMTILLASPLQIDADRNVLIDGTGKTVSITDTSYRRVMMVSAGAYVGLEHITLVQGSGQDYPVAGQSALLESSMISNLGALRINDSQITGNPIMPASMVGSAIANQGTLTVSRSAFTGHSALGGGAIYNDGYMTNGQANVMVIDSTFNGNASWVASAGDVWTGILGGGGAITNFAGSLTVTGSTFTANSANYVGGAVVGFYGLNVLTNNTFAGNSAATSGGAVMLFDGMMTHNTFSGNSAANGSALYVLNQLPMTVGLANNLMVKGSAGANCLFETPPGETAGEITSSHNLADDDSCGTGFSVETNLANQIGVLGDNGGTTQTVPLLDGSPAIDAGDDTLCPATDQRGMTRPQGAACDIGAYELEEVVIPSDYAISGMVYDDLNANGSRDAGEEGMGGAPVILALNLDQIPFNYLTAYSMADGSFQFNLTPPAGGLPAGFSVSVFVEPVTGFKFTQMPAPFAVLTGNLTGMDIGVHTIILTPAPVGFPDGVQGVAYNETITVTGGDAPYTFTPSTWPLPAGLSYAFDEQLGTITLSGTPAEAGEFLAHIDFKDANGAFAQIHEYFTIYPPLQFSPATLLDGSLGTAYSQTITVSGGLPPYTFVMGSEHWLPAGLALDTSSGDIVITGTPTEAGRVTLDVYVSDQSGTTVEVQRDFWIKTAPSLTLTSSLNPSQEGQAITFSLGSTATVADWPAPWGQVTFLADGTTIPGCDGLWLGSNPVTEEPAPNPVTCATSSLAPGAHAIEAVLTTVYGPYDNGTAALTGGQTVNAAAPEYQTAGFTAPVDQGDVINTAKAGQMIPLKWRLLDANGDPVTNLDPASVTLTVTAFTCQTGLPTDAIETYTSGTTSLQNLGNGYYQLNWKTLSSYANSCRQITLKLGAWTGDGLTALFQFKK